MRFAFINSRLRGSSRPRFARSRTLLDAEATAPRLYDTIAELFGPDDDAFRRLREADRDAPAAIPCRDRLGTPGSPPVVTAELRAALTDDVGIRALPDGSGFLLTAPPEAATRVSSVRHEHAYLVFKAEPEVASFEIVINDEATTLAAAGGAEALAMGADAVEEMYFEWRGYVRPAADPDAQAPATGPQLISGLARMDEEVRDGARHWRCSVPVHCFGVIFGTVLRVAGSVPGRLVGDGLAGLLLARAERDAPKALADLRRLDRLPVPTTGDLTIILVHGTLSTCLSGFKDLRLDWIDRNGSLPILRFEHDTLASIRSNADDLADLIRDKVRSRRVLLIAHSRGGLVARWAARQLTDADGTREIAIITCGTPHRGTPLVGAGRWVVRALALAASSIAAGWAMDPTLHQISHLALGLADLPEGIRQMDPGGDFIRDTAACCPGGQVIDVFGGDIAGASGAPWQFSWSGRMLTTPHDGVVPRDSAVMARNAGAHLIDACHHSDYFDLGMNRLLVSIQGYDLSGVAAAPAKPRKRPPLTV